MSLLICTTSLLCALITVVQAQDGKFKVMTLEEEIPRQVVEAFRHDFKGKSPQYWTIGSGQVLTEEYMVSGFEAKSRGEKPTYYFIGFLGSGSKGEAVYNHPGQLLFWKERVSDVLLPDSIRSTIGRNLAGYSFEGEHEVVRDGDSRVMYYLVNLNQEDKLRSIMIDRFGKISTSRK